MRAQSHFGFGQPPRDLGRRAALGFEIEHDTMAPLAYRVFILFGEYREGVAHRVRVKRIDRVPTHGSCPQRSQMSGDRIRRLSFRYTTPDARACSTPKDTTASSRSSCFRSSMYGK